MSSEATFAVEDFNNKFPDKLTNTQLLTLWFLAYFCLGHGFIFNGGNEKLAKWFKISTRSVSTRLKELERLGLILLIREREWGNRNRQWLINLPSTKKESRSELLLRGESELKSDVNEVEVRSPITRSAESDNWNSIASIKREKIKDEKPKPFIIEIRKEIAKTDPVLLPFCNDQKVIEIFSKLEKAYYVDPVGCLGWLIRRQKFSAQDPFNLKGKFRDYLSSLEDVSEINLEQFAKYQKYQANEAIRLKALDEAYRSDPE